MMNSFPGVMIQSEFTDKVEMAFLGFNYTSIKIYQLDSGAIDI